MSLTEFMERKQAALQQGGVAGEKQSQNTESKVDINDLYLKLSDARTRLNAATTTISRRSQVSPREYQLALQDKTNIEAEISGLEKQIEIIEGQKNPTAEDEYWK